jgi:hypothetical protein
MRTLQIRGFKIKVFKTKVKIFDPLGVVSDNYALIIMSYLYEEGFIKMSKNGIMDCEIICR